MTTEAPLAPPLPQTCGPRAQQLLDLALGQLRGLVDADYPSPLAAGFKAAWCSILRLLDEYQEEVLRYHGRAISCHRGCNTCCLHWVVDVNSFEGALMADRIRHSSPAHVTALVARCTDDERALQVLEQDKTLLPTCTEEASDDSVDRVLSSFYRLRRACPLLCSGSCSVYELRPLTCRMYLSLGEPAHCDPESIDSGEPSTFFLDVSEEANTLIDWLHFRYQQFEGNTGLRSLLLAHLNPAALPPAGGRP